MKKLFVILSFLCILFLYSCESNRLNSDDCSQLKQYVIVRFAGLKAMLNDGTSSEDQAVKDEKGEDLKFKSLTGVINYMTSEGWRLEEVIAQPQYRLSSQDASLIFSRPTTMPELKKLVNDSCKR